MKLSKLMPVGMSREDGIQRQENLHPLECETVERARLHPDTFDWSAAPKFSQLHAGTGRAPVEVRLPTTMSPALFDLLSVRCSGAAQTKSDAGDQYFKE